MARPSSRPIELSTTRIIRLLRPLRTKCIALATMHPTPSAAASTYGSKTCSTDSHPLDVLPPPDTVRSYHVEHRYVAGLRVAFYAVRDCFREIVIKSKSAEEVARKVLRLADLCSTIVGENMEGDEDFADEEEDSEQLSEMERIYEIIPVQYRRSALLAHSLDIILHFPHHYTLLSILLDVSLEHGLYQESCLLLHWLLRAAVSPAAEGGSTPRLCHPAHSNYLIDLCGKWREAVLPTSVFARILTTILLESARPELWACKALARFTRELHDQDFDSLINMASHIVSSLDDGDFQTKKPHENPPCKRRTFAAKGSSLTDQLNAWLSYSSSFPPIQDTILEFLDQCRRSGVHRNVSDSLAATVACWATHYLASTTPSAGTYSGLHRLLEGVSPTVTMYNLLVEKTFGVRQPTAVKLQDSRTILQVYAECLRTNGLLLLEASLWACALRFAEAPTNLGACALRNELSLYREELMVSVDDAERRCFQAPQSGWEWEESIGCWIRDSPPAKKAKHHHGLRQRSSKGHSKPSPDIQNAVVAGENHHFASAFEMTFTSIISNALSSRTRLHPNSGQLRPRTLLCSDDTIPTSDDALNLFASPRTKIHRSENTISTSDDALNLFASSQN